MNQGGGWPLNCIALPNGKPVWEAHTSLNISVVRTN